MTKKVIVIISAVLTALFALFSIIQEIRTAYNYDFYYVFYQLGLGGFWGPISVFRALINLLALLISLKVLFGFKLSALSEKLMMLATRILLLLSGISLASVTYSLFTGPKEHILFYAIADLACVAIIIPLFTYFVRAKLPAKENK